MNRALATTFSLLTAFWVSLDLWAVPPIRSHLKADSFEPIQWLALALTIIWTALAWLLPARGHHFHGCASCGYDLTGNETGKCPECGAQVTPEDVRQSEQESREA